MNLLKNAKPNRIGISAVNKHRLGELKAALSRYPVIQISYSEDLLLKQTILQYDKIDGIGADRLFGMIGALSMSKPPLITVDCGTAITINAVNENCECIGGSILAGMQTQLNALAERADALSRIHLSITEHPIGTNTVAALCSGIIYGAAGAIMSICDKVIKEYFDGRDIDIFIIGGGSPILLPALSSWRANSQKHFRDLVLRGILFTLD